ncbi:uncharacterized protein LTR77_008341 [Saxophila tyrrhenica]|uniref:Major facilitator superfamily (MFS) profile domain-containing protein n=1 Tax=Saxophila tyrrhenica TaxID=1690608 RepID=A0AAV9P3I4_9PEZI|nr:hypothetical protein LTR77_008341 [Saxophila tyrrhenica]
MRDDEEQEGLLEQDANGVESPIALRPLDSQAKTVYLEDDVDFDASPGPDSTWTAEEERRVVRKLDFLVMPLLIVAFFALQLDRGNIGNALTDYFLDDVGITQSQFNDGQELLALGIVIWEIPSNFILYRIGPSVWISAQIVAWGLVATFQAFQHGVGAFMLTRFLLGSFESGFIPAALFTISRFYKRNETSKRFSLLFMGNHLAQATSGLIAYAILHMRGVFGLGGWQWLFILEGLFTVSIGILFVALFPKGIVNPTSLTGIQYFTKRESYILSSRVLLDDPSKQHKGENITSAELKSTFTNWKLLPHIIAAVLGLAPGATFGAYGPTLVESFGYPRLASNALMSIGLWLGLIMTFIAGILADRTDRRGLIALGGIFGLWLSVLVSKMLVPDHEVTTIHHDVARFLALTSAVGFSGTWHPVNGSWMALNAPTLGERSITMAILIMSANSAGIIGAQLFKEGDGPLYPKGWSNIVLIVFFGVGAIVVANMQYRWLNRRMAVKGLNRRFAL